MNENPNIIDVNEEELTPVEEAPLTEEKDDLAKAVEAQMEKLRRQSILTGAQAICQVILQKIYTYKAKPGKKSYRDYERLIADIEKFCKTGVSREINEDGTITEKAEEAQVTDNE